MTIYNISAQASNVFLPVNSPSQNDKSIEEMSHSQSHRAIPVVVKKVNIILKDFELDLILEKVPELISSLSNDYLAKIFSMLFTDICYLPIKLPEFNNEMVD